MPDYNVALPSKPKAVREEGNLGVFEIEGLYPGYGHTLGNSLRRIILSSLPGAAITSLKIDGVLHEFSAIDGVKEDAIALILNLKKVRFALHTDEPQTLTLRVQGPSPVTAADIIENPGYCEVLTPEQYLCEITDKRTALSIEMTIEKGLGYLPKEMIQKEKADIGAIMLDAAFTPIRRVNYEVEPMRVGDRTDYNRLIVTIETDGTLTPRKALEDSIATMIHQLKAVVGWQEEEPVVTASEEEDLMLPREEEEEKVDTDILKTRIDSLDLSARTSNALGNAGIRTLGGLVRKTAEDILDLEGIGEKGLQEIRRALSNFGVTLKS
jgi:DNA-directed RNA polymerase subunit alpha